MHRCLPACSQQLSDSDHHDVCEVCSYRIAVGREHKLADRMVVESSSAMTGLPACGAIGVERLNILCIHLTSKMHPHMHCLYC